MSQTIQQRNTLRRGLYEGRTEYKESDYRFQRTCPGFYPDDDTPDWIAPVGLCVAIAVLIALYFVGVNV